MNRVLLNAAVSQAEGTDSGIQTFVGSTKPSLSSIEASNKQNFDALKAINKKYKEMAFKLCESRKEKAKAESRAKNGSGRNVMSGANIWVMCAKK